MSPLSMERHSSDGELMGLLDGESDAGESAVSAHVDICAACSARLARFQQLVERLDRALAATEPPAVDRGRLLPPPDRLEQALRRARRRAVWSHPGLRAAAAIVLAAGVAAASPARAWILERVTGRRAEPSAGRTPGKTARAPTFPAPQSAGSIVWFAPGSNELIIRLDTRPRRGTLALVAGGDSRSSAQIVSGARGEAFLVLPTELRIRNEPRSVADYEVTLAAAVRRVRVQLGGADGRDLAAVDVAPGMRRVIQLGSGERQP